MCNHVTDNGNGIVFECTKNHSDAMHVMKRMAHEDEPIDFVLSTEHNAPIIAAPLNHYSFRIRLLPVYIYTFALLIVAIVCLIFSTRVPG
jgi:hypothetical protein